MKPGVHLCGAATLGSRLRRTVCRRFASQGALIDELLRLATQELVHDAEHAR